MKSFITKIDCNCGMTVRYVLTCCLIVSCLQNATAQVSRSQITSNANSFSNAYYGWTASTSNKWSGTYCGGRNIYYAAPAYGGGIITGLNWGMPYCWGGWSTIPQHNSAMSSGKSAGDICSGYSGGCTASPGGAGLSCASGMDCSGFVSRDWQLSSKYSCTMLDGISTAISPSQVQPGDIYNNTGHVRLVSSYSPSTGNVTVVEASARDWRTSFYTYSPIQLSSYTPRVYNNSSSCGVPTAIYASSIGANSATLTWAASGAVNFTYYIKTASATKYSILGTNTFRTIIVSGLMPSTSYNFKVAHNCSSGSWGMSSVYTFTTPAHKGGMESSGDSITISDGSETAAINGVAEASNAFNMYPNPVRPGDELIVAGANGNCNVSLYTLEGKLVLAASVNSNQLQLALPVGLAPAIYLVKIVTEQGWVENKLLDVR